MWKKHLSQIRNQSVLAGRFRHRFKSGCAALSFNMFSASHPERLPPFSTSSSFVLFFVPLLSFSFMNISKKMMEMLPTVTAVFLVMTATKKNVQTHFSGSLLCFVFLLRANRFSAALTTTKQCFSPERGWWIFEKFQAVTGRADKKHLSHAEIKACSASKKRKVPVFFPFRVLEVEVEEAFLAKHFSK